MIYGTLYRKFSGGAPFSLEIYGFRTFRQEKQLSRINCSEVSCSQSTLKQPQKQPPKLPQTISEQPLNSLKNTLKTTLKQSQNKATAIIFLLINH